MKRVGVCVPGSMNRNTCGMSMCVEMWIEWQWTSPHTWNVNGGRSLCVEIRRQWVCGVLGRGFMKKKQCLLYMDIWRECSLCTWTYEENAVSVHARMKRLLCLCAEKYEQNDMSLCMDFVKRICLFYMKVRKCSVLVRGFMKRMAMQSLVMAIIIPWKGVTDGAGKRGSHSDWVVLIHRMLVFAWSLVFILHYICWCFNLFINFILGVHFVRQTFTCIADTVKKKGHSQQRLWNIWIWYFWCHIESEDRMRSRCVSFSAYYFP